MTVAADLRDAQAAADAVNAVYERFGRADALLQRKDGLIDHGAQDAVGYESRRIIGLNRLLAHHAAGTDGRRPRGDDLVAGRDLFEGKQHGKGR